MLAKCGGGLMEIFKMAEDEATHNIKNNFDTRTRMIFNQAIFAGYAKLNTWLKDDINAFLLSYEKEARGRVINWAVDYFLKQYIDEEMIPFKYTSEYTKNGAFKFLSIHDLDKKMELTINQVSNKNMVARKAKNRDEKLEGFQSSLILDEKSKEIIMDDKPFYYQLNHGYQGIEPNFIMLGIPTQSNNWLASIDISKELFLLSDTKSITTTQVKAKSPDISELLEVLKEEKR